MAVTDGWKIWARGIAYGMESGIVNVPYVLLTHYRKLDLSETEVMLLLQVLAFQQVEHNYFPSMDELEQRMAVSSGSIAELIRRLMKDGWITIDEQNDGTTGVHSESYNLSGLYDKLGQCIADERAAARQSARDREPEVKQLEQQDSIERQQHIENLGLQARRDRHEQIDRQEQHNQYELADRGEQRNQHEHVDRQEQWNTHEHSDRQQQPERNLFVIFEKEFARPLTPMECETISSWVDQDGYPEELILLSLKEAVFAGKVHFRYIDRILLEWSRNRVQTAQDAKAYTQKFRARS